MAALLELTGLCRDQWGVPASAALSSCCLQEALRFPPSLPPFPLGPPVPVLPGVLCVADICVYSFPVLAVFVVYIVILSQSSLLCVGLRVSSRGDNVDSL